MEPLTHFVTSSDGTRIAYDVQGHGPALILLPGRGFPRRTWHEYGYPSRLQGQFTVITLDHRNEGESETPTHPGGYTINHYIADIHAVADACGMPHFLVWGHSFGATIPTGCVYDFPTSSEGKLLNIVETQKKRQYTSFKIETVTDFKRRSLPWKQYTMPPEPIFADC